MNQDIISIINATYNISNTGAWRKLSNRGLVTNQQIGTFVSGLLAQSGNFTAMADMVNLEVWLNEQSANAMQTPVVNANVVVYASEEEYIKAKITEYGFVLSPRGDKIKRSLSNGNMKTVDVGDLEVKLQKDLDLYNALVTGVGRKYKVATLMATLKSFLDDNDLYFLTNLQNSLNYNKEKEVVLDKWLKNLHGVMNISESYEIWEMLMKHMMWLVKRRMYGMDVKYDIWISMFGGQNVGKTYVFTECIFKPFNAYYVMTELSKIEDVDREIQKFTENFVVNFDEIALGNSGDEVYKISDKMLNNLKSILTRSELYIRRMGVQEQMKLDKTFVAVSSANTHLYDVIFDKTGMRRFFEFNTTATEQYDNKHIATLAAMSHDAWMGIDEHLPRGYWEQTSPTGLEINRIQKTYRPKNNVSEWIRGEHVVKSDKSIKVQSAYSSYKMFCTNMGLKAYALPTFRDTLSYHYEVDEDMVSIEYHKEEKKEASIPIPSIIGFTKEKDGWDDL